MIRIFLALLISVFLHAIEYKSNISLQHVNYDNYANEEVLSGNTKLEYENNIFRANLTLEYIYSSEYKDKRYILLNELYATKEFDDYSFSFGKIIKYWGELEGFNIADIYNQKNNLFDLFNNSAKLGSLAFLGTRYFDEDSMEFGIKFYEENQEFLFMNNYDNELELSDNKFTPTFHFSYSFISDKYLDSETKLILVHGYDNKRYFTPINKTTLSQYAYRVNKFLLLSNIIYKDTIFKYEVSYTDVISEKNMSDYAQLSFGLENNIYDIFGLDVGIYSEYYRYIYIQDKIQNVDMSEIYDNDIFLALKLNFNDVRSSEVKGGILYDLQNSERVFKLEAKSRVIDNFVLSSEFLHILPASKTLLAGIEVKTRAMISLMYSF